jgi:hypothetical protein
MMQLFSRSAFYSSALRRRLGLKQTMVNAERETQSYSRDMASFNSGGFTQPALSDQMHTARMGYE